MPSEVTVKDLIEGGSIDVSADGFTAVRTFVVRGLEGNSDARLFDALTANGMPKRGDIHPTIPFVAVDTINVVPMEDSNTQALATVNYKTITQSEQNPDDEQQPVITVGGTTQTVVTNQFFKTDGTQGIMQVEYTFPQDPNSSLQPEPQIGTGTASKQIPAVSFRLQRKETESPLRKAKDFIGKVSIDSILNDPPRAWMCTRIDGTSTDGGETYDVSYEFQRALSEDIDGQEISGWDATITFIDTATGEPPSDILDQKDSAIKTFQVYPTAQFRDLDLGLNLL